MGIIPFSIQVKPEIASHPDPVFKSLFPGYADLATLLLYLHTLHEGRVMGGPRKKVVDYGPPL